jgi:anti-sigma regulatory factor (Ser/Thr protein kinase)
MIASRMPSGGMPIMHDVGNRLDFGQPDEPLHARPMRYEGFATQVRGRVARDAAELYLTERGVGAEAIENALLVLAEFVSNACRHVRQPSRAWISILVDVPQGGGVRIEVRDPNPSRPVRRPVGAGAESGYGLNIVASVATRWGHDRPDPYGKRVWAYLHDTTYGMPGDG